MAKIEVRRDEDDGIDEVIMPGVHLEMLDMDQAYLSLTHNGEHLLIDITATATEEVDLVSGRRENAVRLNVTVAERWEGEE